MGAAGGHPSQRDKHLMTAPRCAARQLTQASVVVGVSQLALNNLLDVLRSRRLLVGPPSLADARLLRRLRLSSTNPAVAAATAAAGTTGQAGRAGGLTVGGDRSYCM